MNASRLLEIVSLIILEEETENVQASLNDVNSQLSQLVSNPAEPSFQTNLSKSLKTLSRKITAIQANLQPAQIKLLEEIGADKFFVTDMGADTARLLRENAATPAVAQNKLNELIQERQQYLEKLNQLQSNLVDMGISTNGLEAGQAEIGFLLPRDLFDNELHKFTEELRVLNRIIRTFSEIVTGSIEPIEVRQISTSDPLLFFGIGVPVVAALGKTVTWALSTWKQVEEIRKIRAETEQIEQLKDEPITQLFDDTIAKQINSAIEDKIAEVIKGLPNNSGRGNELENSLRWALESILARVERGMTVEVRLLPPPVEENEEGEEPNEVEPIYNELQEIAGELVFPKMEGTPILSIPAPEQKKPVPKKAAKK